MFSARITVGALLGAALWGGVLGAAKPAHADSLIYASGPNNCTPLNCNAVTLNGVSLKDGNGDSVPFTAQVYANAGDCLRLDVTYENANLKMEVISPSGAIWRNDDRGSGSLYYDPLVTAVADVKGYYTVVVNYSGGNQGLNAVEGFGLAYGRYYLYTPNCPSPAYPF